MTPRFASLVVPCLLAGALGCDGARDVHAIGRVIRVLDSGQAVQELVDFRSAAVFGDVRGEGGFESYAGQGYVGALVIPDVPEGEYYLTIGNLAVRRADGTLDTFVRSIVTSASDLDLSRLALGRPLSGQQLATVSTTLAFSLSGMSPWADGDHLVYFDANTATLVEDLESAASRGAPTAGATSLERLSLELARAGVPLVDGALGDRPAIVHLSQRTAGGHPYLVATELYRGEVVTMTEGQALTSTGTFSPIPRSRSLTVDWRGSEAAAVAAKVSPGAALLGSSLEVRTLPLASAEGAFERRTAAVLRMELEEPADFGASLDLGGPLSDADELLTIRHTYAVSFTAAGATSPLVVYAEHATELVVPSDGDPVVVAPSLAPVEAPAIEGRDAFQRQEGTGLTPRLSWSPPAGGAAGSYEVVLYRLFASGTETSIELVLQVLTRSPEVTVPPDVLESGGVYFALIEASEDRARDPERTPFRTSLPARTSAIVTQPFTP